MSEKHKIVNDPPVTPLVKNQIFRKTAFQGPPVSTYSSYNIFGAFWPIFLVTWRDFLPKMTSFWRFSHPIFETTALLEPLFMLQVFFSPNKTYFDQIYPIKDIIDQI